jgi:amidase
LIPEGGRAPEYSRMTMRQWARSVIAPSLFILMASAAVAGADGARIDQDLHEVTIQRLQTHYASGTYTARQVVEWHLGRIQKLNAKYKALVDVYGEEALAKASRMDAAAQGGARRGPLWGVPVVIKGNTAIAGKVLANGWQGYARADHALVARRSATVVERFERAGAIILGQSNIPDFVASDSTVSSFGGRTGNAYDVWFSPGGSSGGSGVAVALGFAVIAQGSDTANSIRNPASNASLVGVLPTHGLVSIAGMHPFDRLLDNTGPMARTVTDAALALDAMAAPDSSDPRTGQGIVKRVSQSYMSFLKPGALKGKRLGVPHVILEGKDANVLSAESRAAFMKSVERLRALGAEVIFSEEILPEEFQRVSVAVKTAMYRTEGVAQFLKDYAPVEMSSPDGFRFRAAYGIPLDILTQKAGQFELASDPLAETHYYAPKRALTQMYQSTLRKHRLDAYVYPPLQVPANDERKPLPEGFPSDGPYSRTDWTNRLGVPAVVVPAGFYETGLPYGLEMSADFGQDGELLGYAYAFEQATRARKPPRLDVADAP